MWVTIYSDASYNQRTKLSTYAYYIRSNKGVIKNNGPCPKEVKNITDAETYAAIMALGKAINSIDEIDAICINTDCKYVISRLRDEDTLVSKNPFIKDLILRAKGYLEKENVSLKMRHVKAHTGGSDVRSWCNEICDKGAKKAMGKAIKKHRDENK